MLKDLISHGGGNKDLLRGEKNKKKTEKKKEKLSPHSSLAFSMLFKVVPLLKIYRRRHHCQT